MASMLEKIIFPYGKRPLSDEFTALESVKHYNRYSYNLLDRDYPVKHPLFHALTGSYPMRRSLPTWWNDCIETCPYPLKFFLPSITAVEFFEGNVNTNNWKMFRTFLGEEMKKEYPQSPKLGGILKSALGEDNTYYRYYCSRGTTNTEATLIISPEPEDLFFMSNGDGWSSCQDYRNGGYKGQLRGSMFDTNTAMAYVLSPEKSSIREENSVLARALLRIMRIPHLDVEVVTVDKRYGNDASLEKDMFPTVLEAGKEKGIPVGTSYNGRGLPGYGYNSCMSPVVAWPGGWNASYQDTLSLSATASIVYKKESYYTGNMVGQVSGMTALSLNEE